MGILNKFRNDESGSVVTMTALLLPIIGLMTAAAIDYESASNVRQAAQRALDAAVVSCAASNEECSSDLFTVNMEGHGFRFADDPTVEMLRDGNRVDGAASVELNSLIFGPAAQFFKMKHVSVVSSAIMETPDIDDNLQVDEIVLVFDVSDSMKGAPLDALKLAAEEFLDRIFEAGNPKVTLLPYAANVPFPRNAGFERYLANGAPAGWDGCFSLEGYHTLQDGTMAEDSSLTPLDLGTRVNGRGEAVPYCPPPASEAIFFSSDRDALVQRVRGLEMGFGTATYSALNWAWRSLEDEAAMPFRNDTAPGSGRRAVILISDGMAKIIKGYDDKSAPGNTHDERAQSMTMAACDVLKADPTIDLFTSFISSPLKDNQELAAQNLQACAPDARNFWLIEDNRIPEAMDEMATRMMAPDAKPRPRLVR